MIGAEPYYITQSKRMCKDSGMDPNEVPCPKRFLTNQELERKRKKYSEILSVVSYFSDKLLDSLKGTPILICVSDSQVYLLICRVMKLLNPPLINLGLK